MNLKDYMDMVNKSNDIDHHEVEEKVTDEMYKEDAKDGINKKLDHYTKRAINEATGDDTFEVAKAFGKPVSEIAEDVFGYLGDTVALEKAYNALAGLKESPIKTYNEAEALKKQGDADRLEIIKKGVDPDNSIYYVEAMMGDKAMTSEMRQQIFYNSLVGEGEGRYSDSKPSLFKFSRGQTRQYKQALEKEINRIFRNSKNIPEIKKQAIINLSAKLGIPFMTLIASRLPEFKAIEASQKLNKLLPDEIKNLIDTAFTPVSSTGKAIEGKIFERNKKNVLNRFFEHQKPDEVDLEDWAKVQHASDAELDELINKYKDQISELYN